MSSRKEHFGSYEVILENNEKRIVKVYKKGKSIFLSDNMGDILVHPSNENTEEGWILEYGIRRNIMISSYASIHP